MVNVYLNFSDETKRMDLSPNYEVVLSSRRDLSSPPREILPFEAIVLVKKG
jgi:trehalose-6-phosphate hydrolase